MNRPTFILGCGRSGTTILGRLTASHPDVAYLNEPRHIWEEDPATDIWSGRAVARRGRLHLTADDVDPDTAARIVDRFAAEVRARRRERLVEKLPINSFRVEYVERTCPDARFVHLVRHGADVAASIGEEAARGPWFGHGDYKWHLLAGHAEQQGLGDLAARCTSGFRRGLLEWRLAVETARTSLAALPPQRWTEVRYEDLVRDPAGTCAAVETFLDLAPDPGMRSFAATSIAPVSHDGRRPSDARWDDVAEEIAGPLLGSLGYRG